VLTFSKIMHQMSMLKLSFSTSSLPACCASCRGVTPTPSSEPSVITILFLAIIGISCGEQQVVCLRGVVVKRKCRSCNERRELLGHVNSLQFTPEGPKRVNVFSRSQNESNAEMEKKIGNETSQNRNDL
jgi:hypothetical protein